MIKIIGVPFNSAGTVTSVAGGPAALLNAGIMQRSWEMTTDSMLYVDVGTPSPVRDPSSGLLALDSLITMTAAVRRAVPQALRDGHFPLVLGGDCSLLLGTLKGVQEERGDAGLLFVDGHEDAWPPHDSTTGETADCELGLALGHHREGLAAALITQLPDLAADQVVALGPRDHAELDEHRVSSLASTITMLTDEQLRGRAAEAAGDAVRGFRSAGLPWWLHVDLDVLTTEALPAVDYRQPGGLSWDDLLAVTTAGLASGCIGLSLTDYNPDLDPDRHQAHKIIDYLAAAFATAEVT
ncbi:arginase family protein [Microlunatus parietis]|uniref:Arginase n=1 Tax=Microlunatus parietis TaxID=682979 RepID=A0A7Y9LF19_9ACTN|nr:arginase family protein [Microlunatus parietis]NYE73636.1 arginase [Microlunatus parietis]